MLTWCPCSARCGRWRPGPRCPLSSTLHSGAAGAGRSDRLHRRKQTGVGQRQGCSSGRLTAELSRGGARLCFQPRPELLATRPEPLATWPELPATCPAPQSRPSTLRLGWKVRTHLWNSIWDSYMENTPSDYLNNFLW